MKLLKLAIFFCLVASISAADRPNVTAFGLQAITIRMEPQ
jgi:hypothetical protein